MSDINKRKEELEAQLDAAKASYDSAEVVRLEEEIKKLEQQTAERQEEIKEEKQEANKEKMMKIEELKNLLQDKPENAEKNAELIVEQHKTRLKQTINRYNEKIQAMKEANDTEKEILKKEIETIKTQIKTDKEKYEQVKRDFFATTNYKVEHFTSEDLKKVPTKRYRFETREGKLFNSPKLTKMGTIRRNMTIRKLIKKFNKIGDKTKDGVRFVMGFEKARFLRYTGIHITSAIDKAGGAMGMQISPQEFHARFNAGRKAIFDILDADTGNEKTQGEKEIINALKKRINYYGYTYARERANARVSPFVEAEKNASDDEKILETTKTSNVIQMTPPQQTKAAA